MWKSWTGPSANEKVDNAMKNFCAALFIVVAAILVVPSAGAVPRETAISMCNSFADNKPTENREAFIARCLSTITIDEPTPRKFARAASSFFGFTILACATLLGLVIYFVPTIVAYMRKKSNRAAILILNIFLGWTLIGWVIALVWAATRDPERRAA